GGRVHGAHGATVGVVRSLRHVWLPAPGRCPRAHGRHASRSGARRGSRVGMPRLFPPRHGLGTRGPTPGSSGRLGGSGKTLTEPLSGAGRGAMEMIAADVGPRDLSPV